MHHRRLPHLPERVSDAAHRPGVARRRAFAAAIAVLALAFILGTLGGCGDTSGGTTATSHSSSSSTTSTTFSDDASRLARALTTQVHLSRYAFTIETWELADEGATPVVSVDGLVERPWRYFEVTLPARPDALIELALSPEKRLARYGGSAWGDPASVLPEDLGSIPLEDPDPVEDLIPGIAARATLSSSLPSNFAPAAPTEAIEQFVWDGELFAGDATVASVRTWAWLDARGRLVRLDRETTPRAGKNSPADSALLHTYTAITYSRHADSTIDVPVPTGA